VGARRRPATDLRGGDGRNHLRSDPGGVNAWLAVGIGLVVYGGGLLATGAFRGEDMAAILGALPIGPLRRLLPVG
jgi:hypothetical protein